MLLVSGQLGVKESGLNPFVYSKAKSFLKNWNEQELSKLSKKFVEIYHESHRGNCDLYDEMEKISLSI